MIYTLNDAIVSVMSCKIESVNDVCELARAWHKLQGEPLASEPRIAEALERTQKLSREVFREAPAFEYEFLSRDTLEVCSLAGISGDESDECSTRTLSRRIASLLRASGHPSAVSLPLRIAEEYHYQVLGAYPALPFKSVNRLTEEALRYADTSLGLPAHLPESGSIELSQLGALFREAWCRNLEEASNAEAMLFMDPRAAQKRDGVVLALLDFIWDASAPNVYRLPYMYACTALRDFRLADFHVNSGLAVLEPADSPDVLEAAYCFWKDAERGSPLSIPTNALAAARLI